MNSPAAATSTSLLRPRRNIENVIDHLISDDQDRIDAKIIVVSVLEHPSHGSPTHGFAFLVGQIAFGSVVRRHR